MKKFHAGLVVLWFSIGVFSVVHDMALGALLAGVMAGIKLVDAHHS